MHRQPNGGERGRLGRGRREERDGLVGHTILRLQIGREEGRSGMEGRSDGIPTYMRMYISMLHVHGWRGGQIAT